MLDNIKAVIFDLDGTLVDSMWMWPEIDVLYLRQFGISVTENLHTEIEGMSFSETAAYFKETFEIPSTIQEIKQEWLEMAYGKYANEVPLKPGVLHFLQELKKQNIRTGIATSNGIELVNAVLNAHGLEPYIDQVRTACEVNRGKPAPDIYLKVSEDLGIGPADCLVFEDVSMGILAGKNAGMKVCAVEDEFSLFQTEKKKSLADYYITTYEEIFDHTYEVLNHE